MGDHHDTTPIASFEAQASMDHWEEFNDFVETKKTNSKRENTSLFVMTVIISR